VTQVGSTPTTAAALLGVDSGRRAPAGFTYWAGASAVPVQISREFAVRFGIPIHEGWGMTEMQGAMIVNPTAVEPRLGSVGIAYPYHRARCLPPASQDATGSGYAGEVGVLAISGPCVTPGYLDDARTPELFLEAAGDARRWLNTGDLCTIDNEGYIWLRGRSKDLIIRGGHNIDPLTIEDALLSHPAVLVAAAIGEPDRDKGEMPVAYVQLRPGCDATETELLGHCQSEIIERAAAPRAVRILSAMPLTAVGKIFKPALRLDAIQRCVAAVQARLDSSSAVSVEIRDAGGAITVILRADSVGSDKITALRRELEHYTFGVEVEPTSAG
jgi:fatty-acyl-CoA synthase